MTSERKTSSTRLLLPWFVYSSCVPPLLCVTGAEKTSAKDTLVHLCSSLLTPTHVFLELSALRSISGSGSGARRQGGTKCRNEENPLLRIILACQHYFTLVGEGKGNKSGAVVGWTLLLLLLFGRLAVRQRTAAASCCYTWVLQHNWSNSWGVTSVLTILWYGLFNLSFNQVVIDLNRSFSILGLILLLTSFMCCSTSVT